MIFRSLSFRLTLYSFLLTYLLLIACWGAIYFSVDRELFSRDQEKIRDRLATIQNLLEAQPGNPQPLMDRVEKEWPLRPFERIYVRVLDDDGKVITETPGLGTRYEEILKRFPSRLQVVGKQTDLSRADIGGRIFDLGTFSIQVRDLNLEKPKIVQIAVERTTEDHLLSTLRGSLIYVLIFGSIGSLLIGRLTVRKVLESVHQISEITARVNSADLKERIRLGDLPREFQGMALTFNGMLDRLEESFERLSRFSEDMAHELRTPLNNLYGSLGVALTKDRSAEEYRSLIASSVEECERLKRIIDALLFIARSRQPAHEIQKQALNVEEELKNIISFYEISAERKNITFHFTSEFHGEIAAERVLFQRALGNILANAIMYSPDSSRIQIHSRMENDRVALQITDQGPGIPSELIPHLGERFFRVQSSRSQTDGGSGLGLSIVKTILELHGGEMKIASELGKGSSFSLIFPLI